MAWRDALAETDWSRVQHAYGRATDTPTHLRALAGPDDDARGAAVAHLWGLVLHQGTAYEATAPTAHVVAEILRDAELKVPAPTRAALVGFLGGVGAVYVNSGLSREEITRMAAHPCEPPNDPQKDAAFYEDIAVSDALYARAILACIVIRPALRAAVRPELDATNEAVRAQAVDAMVKLMDEEDDSQAALLQRELGARARKASSIDERCATLLALAEVGGAAPDLLDDPAPSVRVCAALSPALTQDARATAVLVAALEDAAHLDGWFKTRPPQMVMWPRFAVVRALLDRRLDFDRLCTGAIALLGVTNKSCVDGDWGQLLAAAFPEGDGVVRTEAQRRYLRALVDCLELWDPRSGNARRWFREAGLPHDRQACAAKV